MISLDGIIQMEIYALEYNRTDVMSKSKLWVSVILTYIRHIIHLRIRAVEALGRINCVRRQILNVLVKYGPHEHNLEASIQSNLPLFHFNADALVL